MGELELKDFFNIIVRRIWLIIALMCVMMALSIFITTKISVPQYETFTTLMLGKPQNNLSAGTQYNPAEIQTNQMLIGTYSELGRSKAIMGKVNQQLGGIYDYDTLKSKVSINLVNETELIKINVTDSNPRQAAKIANIMASVFMQEVTKIMRIDNVNIIDYAEVPSYPVSPKPVRAAVIFTIFGALLGIFIAFMMEMLDRTVKSSEDVEKHLELPVLGMIVLVKEK